ncbi:FG-GAP repeat protein [Aquisphaera giovannonii]|uniref:FG-GAP repeat protein n=1 Tax=Aquisphaera giovannonii TaxID=406548 RepID=A0A5B9W839_9BACT|nr:CRTAC1 family protein [Aquisphaera giovannonii]QEH36733.1 FG-GAP repeat protein [Aquisphaera giovannonii]
MARHLWPVFLAITLAGCGTATPTGGDRRPLNGGGASASGPAASPSSGKTADSTRSNGSNSQAEPQKSSIAGDRQTVVSSNVTLTKQTESSPFRFTEVSKEWGIDFVEFSGMTANKYFPTANGSGLAIFDYDNDGLMDVYFATCTELPLGTGTRKEPNRLFKNLGNGKFKDVTEAAGVGHRGFTHGVIAADLDNDGDQDLFLCCYGPNVLLRNNGDGTFKDISKAAGIDKPNWSSGGAVIDYDNDGDLDIYVANYGRWNYPEDHTTVGDLEKKIYLYSSPRTIKTVRHLFYRNNGDMTFTDVYDKVITVEKEEVVQKEEVDPATKAKKTVEVKEKRRVPHPRDDGHGFGVVAADLNDDGLTDLYVANDMNPHFLFLNNGDGTFDDVSEVSGAAFDNNGIAQSGMGVDAEDVDGDGLPEIISTHFANEYATFYMNYGKGLFYDNTAFFGLASDTMPFVKWGTGFLDFDNDGWPDLFISNGHVDDNRRELNQPVDYEEIPLLFRNMQGKRFKLSTKDVGPYFDTRHVGRGSASGDLDNDGDIDLIVNEKDRPAAVLRNDTPTKNHWVRLVLQGTKSNRDAVGTRIEVDTGRTYLDPRKNEQKPWKIYRQKKGGVSLESTSDSRVLIGIGETAEIPKITIRWPSGIVSTLEKVQVDRDHKVVEPKDGKPAPAK